MTFEERDELQSLIDRFTVRGPDAPMTTREIERMVQLQQHAACDERFIAGSHWRLNLPGSPTMLVERVGCETVALFREDGSRYWIDHGPALACLVAADFGKTLVPV